MTDVRTRLIDPRDVAAGTGDRAALGTVRDQPATAARHLHVEDFDRDWHQIPDGPLGSILVGASLLAIIVAMVLL